MIDQPSCETCDRFLPATELPWETHREGWCRRYPPVLIPELEPRPEGGPARVAPVERFPRVKGHNRCGEHAPIPDRAPRHAPA